jgi:uncharacterized protein YndB with AHSA1/START domain
MMGQWWGPKPFTAPLTDLDVRVGGRIHLVMRSPNGDEFPLTGEYREIVPPSRIVYYEQWNMHPAAWQQQLPKNAKGEAPVGALLTVTFEERGARTLLTLHHEFETPEIREFMERSRMADGWRTSLEKLDELVASSDREIVVTREVAAPRDVVFDAFTDAEHIAEWWGPDGFTNTVHSMDVRVGGEWRYMMHGPDGTDWDNVITYIEVVRPRRLVFWQGDTANPKQFRTTITLAEIAGGRTAIRMRALLPSAEAREQVAHYAVPGGEQNLAKLEAYLGRTAASAR